MLIDGEPWRPIWLDDDGESVGIIDQTKLPFRFSKVKLQTVEDAADAIRDMLVRGAPLIGATAAYGMALAMREDASEDTLNVARRLLMDTRPTAVNLRWALDDMAETLRPLAMAKRPAAAYRRAAEIVEEDVETNRRIGEHGLKLMRAVAAQKGEVNVLTHCNAGWLATCDWGTATAPIYLAHDAGLEIHVWVDETRPRNQGGHLMQHGRVDLCLVGTDRTTSTGDVCNKIGTYLKALAAADCGVPFYVCLPGPTIDWTVRDGHAEIPIEERDDREVTDVSGLVGSQVVRARVVSPRSPVANPAFDVTPSRLITGLITERGITEASEAGLRRLYPEKAAP